MTHGGIRVLAVITVAALGLAAPAHGDPGQSIYDQNFLHLMAQEGWGCTDTSDADQCAKEMVSFAHQACIYSGQPLSFIDQMMPAPSFFGATETRRAIANASHAYPNCVIAGSVR